ncbi:Mrp/NBP35 family ATP-binding protein [Anaerosporobacter sp.]|uniref:Mrp/NBP35 family ATP-binding protein n=1 Tax=Anaerosporobacter sp. TaxID=1872529 RepID=UPI00286F2C18|nr:Mrp/NBP35 family ATP-binding protein [Anaerosporobacter sp.]
MSENCTSNCSTCSSDCASRKPSREEMFEKTNEYSNVKKVIGVVSGKGGVGKSLITSSLSVLMRRKGYHTAILDADVTGPSIPKAFGVHEKALADEHGIIPAVTKVGTKLMSVNLLLENEETPVVWRGPVISGTVKQFWSEVNWGDVDYMFVDMPPGTGDVPLTVFQSIPLDGIVIVTSPQELVSMIVAKAVNMAKTMQVPILGVVENYSYYECDNCGTKLSIFGESHVEETAEKYDLDVLAKIPINPEIAKKVDAGEIEDIEAPWLDEAISKLESKLANN